MPPSFTTEGIDAAKHIGAVFQKLGLTDESEVNRRVIAVLTFLEVTGGTIPR